MQQQTNHRYLNVSDDPEPGGTRGEAPTAAKECVGRARRPAPATPEDVGGASADLRPLPPGRCAVSSHRLGDESWQ